MAMLDSSVSHKSITVVTSGFLVRGYPPSVVIGVKHSNRGVFVMRRKPDLFKLRNIGFLLVIVTYAGLQLFLLRSAGLRYNDDLSSFEMYLISPTISQPDVPEFPEVPIDLTKEIQKGLDYARSVKSTKRKLVFLHIPKTAGSAIEDVGGFQANLPWGSCLFRHWPKRKSCKFPPGQFKWPSKIGYWHLPKQLFPLKGVNPYHGADIFAVVRDPYDRLLSEFYYICRRKPSKYWNAIDCNVTRIHEPEYMNEWIQHKLNEFSPHFSSPEDLLKYNGHYTPQFQFLVSYPSGVRMVDYVLRMDNLNPEFDALMKAYRINATMPPHKTNAARNETHDLGKEHLDKQTLKLFHERYGYDVHILDDGKLP